MGESGGSAERRAEELRARGKRSAGAWAAGADGERRVAAALAALPSDWLVLHDRLLMPGLAESNLDHLLVGPPGIVLIDAKNWAGHIAEQSGSVYQHSTTREGFRQHRPVDREISKLRTMATEVARRTGANVLIVICLAGRQAAEFGEPRVVHGVWILPIGRLVAFLTSRLPIPIADRRGLEVRVRTEFPSATTDAALLVAMGHAIDPHRGIDMSLHGGSAAAPRRSARPSASPRPARPTGRAPASPGAKRKGPRRRDWPRSLFALLLAVGLLAALQTGAYQAAASAVGSFIAGSVTRSLSAGGAASAPTAKPSPTKSVRTPASTQPSSVSSTPTARTPSSPAGTRTRLSCDAFDPAEHEPLAKLKLKASETAVGCTWTLPPRMQLTTSPVRIVQIIEDTRTFGLNPMFDRSTDQKAPVLSKAWNFDGWNTHVWVSKGIRLRSGNKPVTTTRYVAVVVAHEALGLTEEQGRSLGLAISRAASTRPLAGAG